jgi:hypothetical protein
MDDNSAGIDARYLAKNCERVMLQALPPWLCNSRVPRWSPEMIQGSEHIHSDAPEMFLPGERLQAAELRQTQDHKQDTHNLKTVAPGESFGYPGACEDQKR